MPDVFEIEPQFAVRPGDSYLAAYPHFLRYFSGKTVFTESDLVCGAHLVYGWMPTILELHVESTSLASAAALLTLAKQAGFLSNLDTMQLASVVNRSLVGASKLLHFVDPVHFPIWDSRICALISGKPPQYGVRQISAYRDYVDKMKTLEADPRMAAFHASVNRKVGYDVSGFRALELVMFQHREKVVGGS